MRSRGGRTIKVNPVDDDHHQVQEHPDRGRIEALFDQNLFRLHVRRERSSAYWFAASLWGMSGLVLGSLLGAFVMYSSMRAAIPVANDAMNMAIAQERGRRLAEDGPGLQLEPGSTQNQPEQPQQDR